MMNPTISLLLYSVGGLIALYGIGALGRETFKRPGIPAFEIDDRTARQPPSILKWLRATEAIVPRRRFLSSISGLALGILAVLGRPISDWNVSIQILIVALFSILGYRFPALLDEANQKEMRRQIESDLPGVIDLLVIMLEAGATFDEALSRVIADDYFRDRAIKRELGQLAQELALSPDRQAAFQKFSYTAKIEMIRHFNSVLVQSELYGTPVSKGLRGLVLEMRQKQFNEIEAKSGALGPQLTIPMTLFFLPLIFIVVLAPTLIRAFKLS